jgi:tetratricopeptide (TPR) repeat protein
MKKLFKISFSSSILALFLFAAGCATHSPQPTLVGELKKNPAMVKERSLKYFAGMTPGAARAGATCKDISSTASKQNQDSWVDTLNGCVGTKQWDLLDRNSDAMAKWDVESPWPNFYRSISASEKGDFRRAIWMIDQAEQKSGQNEITLFQRARILTKAGFHREAVEAVEKSLAQNPQFGAAQLYLAQIYRRDQETELALKYYQQLMANEPRNQEALTYVANVRYDKGDKKGAMVLYQNLIDDGISDPAPYIKMGQYYEEMASRESAGVDQLTSAIDVYRRLQGQQKSGKVSASVNLDLNKKLKDLDLKLQTSKTKKQASVK